MQNNTKKRKNRAKPAKKSKNQGPSAVSAVSERDFLLLQQQWYKKLQQTGFKDLEHFSFRPSNPNAGQPGPMLKGQSLYDIAKNRSVENPQETYHHYSRLRNFLTHNPRWAGPRPIHSLAARLYTDGIPYSGIVRAVKEAGLKDNINKWHIHHIVKEFEAKAVAWNREHHLGLDFESDI